jgi:CheY-like chemotaxis protein
MDLEQKLKEVEIKKILIVDDTAANIEAAKEYFKQVEKLGVKVEYASSAKEAKERIQAAYWAKDKYSIVISDLSMEEPKSGLEVAREAFKHLGFGFIATGLNYDRSEHDHHGPSTRLMPMESQYIAGKKDKPEVWQQAFEKAIDYLTEGSGRATFAAMRRYDKYIGAPSDEVARMTMMVFMGRNV